MLPILAIVMTFSIIFTFTDFQLVYAITRGGPVNSTHLLAKEACRMIRENPFRGLRQSYDKQPGRDMSAAEFQAILRHSDPYYRRFLIALKLTGARPGEMPAGIVQERSTLTVKITAIDPKAPSVTFVGPHGDTRTIMVQDPKKLQGVSVGDTVELVYTEFVSLGIQRPVVDGDPDRRGAAAPAGPPAAPRRPRRVAPARVHGFPRRVRMG
jgi:hypothetical protein